MNCLDRELQKYIYYSYIMPHIYIMPHNYILLHLYFLTLLYFGRISQVLWSIFDQISVLLGTQKGHEMICVFMANHICEDYNEHDLCTL